MADDVAILTMAISYLCIIFKCKLIHRYVLIATILIICFVGVGIRGYGMTFLPDLLTILIISIVILLIRTVAPFIGIPTACKNK